MRSSSTSLKRGLSVLTSAWMGSLPAQACQPLLQPVPVSTPSFEQLVDTHYKGLYHFALSMCRRETTAQDLVQQTFLQWAKKGHTLHDGDKAKTWLFTTLRREWLRIAMRDKKYEHVEFDPEQHGSEEINDDEAPQVDAVTLQRALEQLDPNYRITLVCFYFKQLSYKDIATVLDVPVGTVMSRLSRGKDCLRGILRRIEGVTGQTNSLA